MVVRSGAMASTSSRDGAGEIAASIGGRARTLLDIAADVLGANPSASLSEVAAAAGIGRTTLHKQYATRQDLLKAVAAHVTARAEQATRIATDVARDGAAAQAELRRRNPAGQESGRFHPTMVEQACSATDTDTDQNHAEADNGPAVRIACALELLVREFIPLGGGLAFLTRHPMFDDDDTVQRRFAVLEPAIVDLVRAGQQHRVLRTDLPDWWFVRTLYAQVRVAAEEVASGRLAPLAAPDLVLNTLVEGLGAR